MIIKELDVRELPQKWKHSTIFETFNSLNVGDVLQLVNDHDPTPLKFQFFVEHAESHHWEYIECGPDVWRINITKLERKKRLFK